MHQSNQMIIQLDQLSVKQKIELSQIFIFEFNVWTILLV